MDNAQTASVKAFIKDFVRSKLKYVQTLANALIFLPVFLYCVRMYSSNFKFRSMIIPKSFCEQISERAIIANITSCL